MKDGKSYFRFSSSRTCVQVNDFKVCLADATAITLNDRHNFPCIHKSTRAAAVSGCFLSLHCVATVVQHNSLDPELLFHKSQTTRYLDASSFITIVLSSEKLHLTILVGEIAFHEIYSWKQRVRTSIYCRQNDFLFSKDKIESDRPASAIMRAADLNACASTLISTHVSSKTSSVTRL